MSFRQIKSFQNLSFSEILVVSYSKSNYILLSFQNAGDVRSLQAKELDILLKQHGKAIKGKRQHKISIICEVLGFIYEPNSYEAALSEVKHAVSGWTKDIRKAPAIDMRDVVDYLLKSHDTMTHTASGDIETFTAQNLRRYKTLRSYSLYTSGHVHSMAF